MGYDIEVMSIGADIYPLLQRSISALNAVQGEFRFHATPLVQRQEGICFERSSYQTSDLWTFLREQREKFGGHRPYIIAFVTRPLESSRLRNIFGSHEAAEGLAVVTMFDAGQYVKEESRYCSYYLTRYSMSFVNPSIKAHDDSPRSDCYFHRKMYKPDIRVSMDSGVVCDECLNKLDRPSSSDNAHRLSDEERQALQRMRQFVSGDLPYAVVMKGGGVKGLAFAGALLELEKYCWFDRHVGTSAGAIAAVLLAASYTPAELKNLLLEKEFRDFMDSPVWKIPLNLVFRQGCYPGESFRIWLADLLHKKIDQIGEISMSKLNGALIYAARWGTGAVTFDSLGERKDTVASFAVRCSMSIPIFFFPQLIEGRRVVDGGLRNNFPLAKFLAEHPRPNVVALYLGKPDNRNKRSFGSELLDILIDGEERQTVDNNRDKVVVIDTSPIGTVDFRLTQQEKEFLLAAGKAAALKFLSQRNLDDGPAYEDVKSAQDQAESMRVQVREMRARVQQKRGVLLLGFILCAVLIGMVLVFGAWRVPSKIDCREKGSNELDGTYQHLVDRNLNLAARAVNGKSGPVAEIMELTWSRPQFAAKYFVVEVRSKEYPIEGFAAIHGAPGQQESESIEPCTNKLNDGKSLIFRLPSDQRSVVIFFRVTVPDLEKYSDPHATTFIAVKPMKEGGWCSGNEEIRK